MLNQKQILTQVLSPLQIQVIKLTQLNTEELFNEIHNKLDTNIFLKSKKKDLKKNQI